MEELILMKDMTDTQKMMFQSEMGRVRKDRTTALMLTLLSVILLFGIGVQHFYMGKIGAGVASVLLFWTVVPLIISFIQLFTIMGKVDQYNSEKAQEIAAKVKIL